MGRGGGGGGSTLPTTSVIQRPLMVERISLSHNASQFVPTGLLTNTVEKHGGDILKFAGDAIIVCWSPTRELGVEVRVQVGCRAVVAVGAAYAEGSRPSELCSWDKQHNSGFDRLQVSRLHFLDLQRHQFFVSFSCCAVR